ncbi:MAG: imidazolonepropionase [Bdellovibrionota bacterium]|nr:MAG: imidazolonepropionase [Bdellovibrionota bacterium]
MPILKNIRALYSCSGKGSLVERYDRAALAWHQGRITWLGPQQTLPASKTDDIVFDAENCVVIPGLIDCHTHLAFRSFRSEEFEAKIRGVSYLEIARQGGGIMSTVRSTRATSNAELEALCLERLREMLALGITTIEAKSGYGLDEPTELRILELYRRLSSLQPIEIAPTFLGAHVVPLDASSRQDYIELIERKLIPEVSARGLAQFCDVFVEEGAFSVEEARAILHTARQHGLRSKLHVDQLADGGGALLAAEIGAISADHLEHVSAHGINALKHSGTIAVLLPFASLFAFQPPAPGRDLQTAGVRVAVATDFNPGTAPSSHLPFALSLACTLNRLTPSEALAGATWNAAAALGLSDQIGALTVGRQADFVTLRSPSIDEWLYCPKSNCTHTVFKRGIRVHEPR